MTDQNATQRLFDAAISARHYAYAPYSKFAVGAAVLCEDGKLYDGCNIENASFGLTICAERVALFKAVSEGNGPLVALALVTNGGHNPCGACRQVMAEFVPDQNLRILVGDASYPNTPFVETSLRELLPGSFKLPKSN